MRTSLNRLINEIENSEVDAAIISQPQNRRYVSGFTGSSGILFVHPLVTYLITDFRYIEQGKRQCPDCKVIEAPGKKALEFILETCKKLGVHSIWFEEDYVTYKGYNEYRSVLADIKLVPIDGVISGLRMVKTSDEVVSIRKAAQLADYGFRHILDYIKPGKTEKDIALELEFFLRKNGSDGLAFNTIIASGENSAMPHAQPSDKHLNKGDMVVMDFGCVIDGYCSDMTRTVALGDPDPRMREVYDIVLKAQLAALQELRPGIAGMDADKAARDYIAEKGYGDYFGHGLGHGVGLNVHEAPVLSPKGNEPLKPNMVVTVEPGIYLPGLGGVRIEDLVVITDKGIDNLTSSPKELIII